MAELLLQKETITNMDVAALIGKRPFQQSEVTQNPFITPPLPRWMGPFMDWI